MRWQALSLSILLHACLLLVVLILPVVAPGVDEEAVTKSIFRANMDRLVWYDFRQLLPSIRPPKVSRRNREGRVKQKADQRIETHDRALKRGNQLIWRPEFPRQLERDVPLPNLVARKTPELAAPPKLVAPAPVVPAQAPDLVQPRFELADRAPTVFKQPVRKFLPPPDKQAARPAKPVIEDAPRIGDVQAAGGQLNAAVIGLNPSANLNAPIPEASRQVEISVGPPGGKGRSSGADKDAVQVGDLNVTVRGGQGGAAKALPDSPPRPKAELISATIFISAQEVDQRRGMYSVPVKVERMSVAERVKSTFQGKNFYLLIVQRPNTGNYSQDWMLWFAERTPLPGDSPRVHPPIPFRIVDPASVKSTISKQFEGTVQLGAIVRKTGFVDDVRILSGFDDTFDQAAREALRRWTFVPALRSGIMVDVDVVVEIPFLARPKEQIAGANGGSK